MYDLSIFTKRGYGEGLGLFQEAEIIAFTEPFLQSMVPLINTSLGVEIKEFYKRADAILEGEDNAIAEGLRTKIRLMHKILDKKVKEVTLPVEYSKSGALQRLWNIQTSELQAMSSDELDELIAEMEAVKDDIFDCSTKLAPRTRADFRVFVNQCKILALQVDNLEADLFRIGIQINKTPELLKWIDNADHNIFYTQREKEVHFSTQGYQLRVAQLYKRLEGAKYRKHCLENKTMLRKIRYIKLQ